MNFNDYLGLIGFSGLSLGLGFNVIGLFMGSFYLVKREATFFWIYQLILIIQFCCLFLAVFSLGGLLLNNAFEYPIVFDSVERAMPWFQKLSGLWSGQSSSLLFWSFILSGLLLLISAKTRKMIDDHFSTIASLILGIALIFFLAPVLILSNPFEKLWQLTDQTTLASVFAPAGAGLIVPMDGIGMNPSLRHVAMLLHPPFLYFGLVGFFVPYAIILAALIMGDRQIKWIRLLMPVSLASWSFLTLGMVLGSWWAYTILGWGGYWGWDAVEIAGLLPWLLSFGLIHSLKMQIAGKNFLSWIVVFSGLIFFSILSGILITRSGILESVHAYSAGVMGPVLTIFIVLNVLIFLFFVINRFHLYKVYATQTRLTFSDLLIYIFNYLILALVLLLFIGQTFPLSSELITGMQISWTAEQYELCSFPFLLLLLLVTALCPLSAYFERHKKTFLRKLLLTLAVSLIITLLLIFKKRVSFSSGLGFFGVVFLIITWTGFFFSKSFIIHDQNTNDSPKKWLRSGFGSIVIHIGLGLMAFGIMGQEALSESYEVKMSENELIKVGGIEIVLKESRQGVLPEGTTYSEADFLIEEEGRDEFILTPDLEYYSKMEMLYARPAISSNLLRDIQIILVNWKDEQNGQFGVHISNTPFMIWIWIGGFLMSLGGIFTLCRLWILKKIIADKKSFLPSNF